MEMRRLGKVREVVQGHIAGERKSYTRATRTQTQISLYTNREALE